VAGIAQHEQPLLAGGRRGSQCYLTMCDTDSCVTLFSTLSRHQVAALLTTLAWLGRMVSVVVGFFACCISTSPVRQNDEHCQGCLGCCFDCMSCCTAVLSCWALLLCCAYSKQLPLGLMWSPLSRSLHAAPDSAEQAAALNSPCTLSQPPLT
jgi:hypothetical protein